MNYLKRFIKRIILIFTFLSRIERIETLNFNRRLYAVDQIAQYLVGAKIDGDYLEFGVYQGTVFTRVYHGLKVHYPKMRFFAFDSFEGLPAPKGIDNIDGFSSNYHSNEFACSIEEFKKNLTRNRVNLDRVELVKGWYNKTLKPNQVGRYGIKKAALIWIDSDLYESAVPVLNFITPYLAEGTVIVFDDWHAFRNNPDRGEQKACKEWLKKNPKIKLAELFNYGYGGVVFTVISSQNEK